MEAAATKALLRPKDANIAISFKPPRRTAPLINTHDNPERMKEHTLCDARAIMPYQEIPLMAFLIHLVNSTILD